MSMPIINMTRQLIIVMALGVMTMNALQAQQPAAGNVIYFDLNKPTLNAAARQTLNELIKTNKIKKDQNLLLYGYADYLGTRAHNDSLSTDRAMNTRAYLIDKGIPERYITVCVGKGMIERKPGAGQKGYAKDRKVEVITDAARLKALTCKPLADLPMMNWSKNVSSLNVHATHPAIITRDDSAVSERLSNGDKYVGKLSAKGMKINKGTYQWVNGNKYTGDYKDDKKDGHGIFRWANGDILEGMWKEDEIQTGTLVIPYNGPLYHSDSGHTRTHTVYSGNLVYTGMFTNRMLNGSGKATWPNMDRYDGEWANDKMNGHGIYYWSTGEYYDGEWKDNKMWGTGKLFNASGAMIQVGIWENDVYKGR